MMDKEGNPKKGQLEQSEQMKLELPVSGTSLNPLESDWVFEQNAMAAPEDQLGSAMQQGE